MRHGGRSKFVIYRDVQDGYRWRLRSAAGETLSASSRGHREKSSCYEEMRTVMAKHPAADILDVAVG
jgi:uncharacterized protein YegP (UPF0339 family)